MHIKINHLKSIGSTLDFHLRDINLFIGPNGGGKSILPNLIQLFKRNDAFRDMRRRQFPILNQFDPQEDWGNWAHNGQMDKATTVIRSASFLNQKVNLMIKMGVSHSVESNHKQDWRWAQVQTFTIQVGQVPLLIWGTEVRRINTRQLALYLNKAIKNYGKLTPKDWEDGLGIPFKQGVQLSSAFFKEYLAEGPEYYEFSGSQLNFFSLDIQAMFFRQRMSIAYNPHFEPITLLMEKVLLSFQQSMFSFLIDSPVLSGRRKFQWEENAHQTKNIRAQTFFGFSIEQQKILRDDGTFMGHQLLVNDGKRKEALEKCCKGYQVACSWIEEWNDAVRKTERQTESRLFSAEKVFFIQHPEQFLHPDWQVKLLRMMLDDARQHSNWKIVIETHSQVIIDELIHYVSCLEIQASQLAIFEIKQDESGQTGLNSISHERYKSRHFSNLLYNCTKAGLLDIGASGWN